MLVVITSRTTAQLCTGRLGTASASITFGSPANPVSITGSTPYNLNGSGCPAVGEYSLPYLSFDCSAGTWHTIVADHSAGDVNGYFMLVNAAASPSQLYTTTVGSLCNGSNYEFSFWVLNMVKPGTCEFPVDPNLEYSITTLAGQTLATGTSGALPQTSGPTWKKVGIFFQPPAGVTSVRFVISTKTGGGCGNTFAIDDIEFAPCGPDINVSVGPTATNYYQMCADAQIPVSLNGTYSSGYNNPVLQWQIQTENSAIWEDIPGANSTAYIRAPTAAGSYTYRLSIAEGANINSPNCRIYSSPVTVFVEPSPDAQLTSYVYGCYGGTVVLYAAGGSNYYWTGPNGFSSSLQLVEMRNIQFTDAGKYMVRVTSASGCSGTDSLDLIIYPAANISVTGNASVCEGTPVNLNAIGGLRFLWWPPDGLSNDTIANPVAKPSNTTLYTVRVTNQYGCSDTGSVTVNIWKTPKADAGPDKKIRPGLQAQLDGKITGNNYDYFWTPLDFMTATNSLRPVVSPTVTTTYTLHATSREGCGSTYDEVKVVVYDKIVVPNVFSPNHDGINDTWFIEPLYLFPECKVEVYNRYGEIVYRSNGYDNPWDGRKNGNPLPTGVYYYIIDLKNPPNKPLTGSVTILR
jgi:gliding motility-associated-like protein